MRPALATTVLALLALAACGGSDDEETATNAGSTAGKSGSGAGKSGAAGSTAGAAGASAGAAGTSAGSGGSTAGASSGAGGTSSGGAGAAGAAGGSAGAGGASAGGSGKAGGAGTSGGAGGATGGGAGQAGQAGSGGQCVAESAAAKLEKKPVDIITYIDSSGSMAPALTAVQATIESNLAATLEASSLDFRVIVMTQDKVPTNPKNPAVWFHYPELGGSGALHENLLNWFSQAPSGGSPPGGYVDWLRTESFKFFLVISDTSSGPTMSGAAFDQMLLALSPAMFGTAQDRRYRYHAIIGLHENDPATTPWPPSAPIVTNNCTGYGGALGSGDNAQEVAILTGGLRFPMCQFGAYDVVFKTIAQGIVQSTPVSCSFAVPMPGGKSIDPNTILLQYTPGAGAKQTFTQAKSLAECKPGMFYVAGGMVQLCPDACTVVKADPGAKIDVTYGCDVGFKP